MSFFSANNIYFVKNKYFPKKIFFNLVLQQACATLGKIERFALLLIQLSIQSL